MKTKIFIIIISCFCIWNLAVYANNGDISSTLYNTDIITYFDGKQIEGYSLDGRMMICLEDLKNYGYTVEYDDSIRTLFVNKDGEVADDFSPYFERGTAGGIAGYTYETDIKAYVNGVFVNTENIGGRLVAVAEELADVTETDNPNKVIGMSKYFMNYNYDDVERILNIYSTTDSFLNAEQMLNNLNNMKTPLGQEFYAALVKKVYPIYDMEYLVYVNQSSSHGYNSFLYLLKNNGEYIDLNNIFKQYNFITEWGKLNVSGEEDGLFISKDNTSVLFSKNVDANIYDKSEETNKYCLDLRSLIIYRK